jgi:hypothetical protein
VQYAKLLINSQDSFFFTPAFTKRKKEKKKQKQKRRKLKEGCTRRIVIIG